MPCCIIGGSCHRYHFCRDKTRLFPRQKYACCDKTFVATNIFLSRQAYFCNKCLLVATKPLPRRPNFLVATKIILVAVPFNSSVEGYRSKLLSAAVICRTRQAAGLKSPKSECSCREWRVTHNVCGVALHLYVGQHVQVWGNGCTQCLWGSTAFVCRTVYTGVGKRLHTLPSHLTSG